MSDAPKNSFTDDEIKALESEHEDVLVLCDPFDDEEGRRFTFVLKPAEPMQWRSFEMKATDDDKKVAAMPEFIKACVVAVAFKDEKAVGKEAARPLFDRLLKRYPAAASGVEVVRAILKFNGASKTARGK